MLGEHTGKRFIIKCDSKELRLSVLYTIGNIVRPKLIEEKVLYQILNNDRVITHRTISGVNANFGEKRYIEIKGKR